MAWPEQNPVKLFNLPTWVALGCLVITPSAYSQAYKWVDEDGKVHYSQTVPPENSDRERKRLTEAGVLIPEQLYRVLPDAEEPPTAEEEAVRLAQLKAEQRDRSLRVYTSQKHLEAARDQALSMIAGELRLTESGYEHQLEALERLVDFAASQDRSGRSVNGDLRQRISNGRQAASAEADKISQLENRAETIREQFQTDVRRWRVIKGIDEPEEETQSSLDSAGSTQPSGVDASARAGRPAQPDNAGSG